MKKHFLTATAVLMSIYSYGQTKGTSTISLGFSSSINEYKNDSFETDQTYKNKYSQLRIGYGLFVSDNNKVGLELLYDKSHTDFAQSQDFSKDKGYGLGLSYQHYFQIVKTFYAFAGASGEYSQNKGKYYSASSNNRDIKRYDGSLAAIGGLTWFISKRWALETNLVSVGGFYSKYEDLQDSNAQNYDTKTQSFGLSTSQTFDNLGFKVYLMF